MLYSGIFSLIYGAILSKSFEFTSHDLFMGFLLGVPQLALGFICITIGSRTTASATVGLLMLMETLCGPLWVWLFLNETLTNLDLLGFLITTIGVYIATRD